MIVQTANRIKEVKEYFFVKKLDEIRQLKEAGHHVINFGIGSPDLPPSEQTIEALKSTAEKPDTHGYQNYRGIPELRKAISNWYQNTYQVTLNPEKEILPLAGSKEGILHISMAFLNQNDGILVPNPGYPAYSAVAKLMESNIYEYDVNDKNNGFPDLEKLEKEYDLDHIKLMWINYPHMPTGKPPKKEKFKEIIDFGIKNKILICHDNPYSLVLNQHAPLSIHNIEKAKDVAIELNSLSKSHNMAGWRVGMITAGEEYIQSVLKVKSNMDSGMFMGTQKAAIAALKNTDEWHKKRNAIYEERKEWIKRILDILEFEYDSRQEGLFVWAKPKDPDKTGDINAFLDKLLYQKHLFFTPGYIFGSNGKGHIRASLCVPLDEIKEAYKRIKN